MGNAFYCDPGTDSLSGDGTEPVPYWESGSFECRENTNIDRWLRNQVGALAGSWHADVG